MNKKMKVIEEYGENIINEEYLKNKIYSNCYSSYQQRNFKEMGYILHRVNHRVWFRKGLFHTNTIKCLWSQIKSLPNNFSGVTLNMIENMENKGINVEIYFIGIYYAFFLRNVKKKKIR